MDIGIVEQYVEKVWFDSFGRERVTIMTITKPVEVEMELKQEDQI